MIKLKNPNLRYAPEDATEHEKYLASANRNGLAPGMIAILEALDTWFKENPEGPRVRDIVKYAGVSKSLIWYYLPVLEALGYIRINRKRNGRMMNRGVFLFKAYQEPDQ